MLTVTLKKKKSYTTLLSPSGRKYVLKENVPTEIFSKADLDYIKSDTNLNGFLSLSGEKTENDILKRAVPTHDLGNETFLRQDVVDGNVIFNNSVIKPMSMVSFTPKDRPLLKPNAGKGYLGDTFEEKRAQILKGQVLDTKPKRVKAEDPFELFDDSVVEDDAESSFSEDEIKIEEDVKVNESDDVMSFDDMNFDELDEVENIDSDSSDSEEETEVTVVKKKKKKVRPE
ncbi:MAG TPA: hypothetical protein VIY47_15830 [Ignavibacteriaceae bacterium]